MTVSDVKLKRALPLPNVRYHDVRAQRDRPLTCAREPIVSTDRPSERSLACWSTKASRSINVKGPELLEHEDRDAGRLMHAQVRRLLPGWVDRDHHRLGPPRE